MASNALTLKEIPTLTQLYRAKLLSPAKHTMGSAPSKALNDILSHIRHDITNLQVDCIVNAANRSLLGGGGVDGAIHRAAGYRLLDECRTLNGCRTGDAKITNGYNLPATKIIHTVGPIYDEDNHELSETLLRSCYRRSLELAVENGQRSIAFSAVSTGVYGYPNEAAARAVLDEVDEFLREGDNLSKFERVIFCSFMPADVRAYERYFPVYFPPTDEDIGTTNASVETKTNDDTVIVDVNEDDSYESVSEDEQDWEELSRDGGDKNQELDEEPVDLNSNSQSASVTDVQSMQSSSAEFDELSKSETENKS
ncbi:O-acetyl-ADP-ribose deacetylase MACROD2 [Talaromyces pinophilus]|nr:O-acetyl-ADP-ribose deacetylase MACROD2 [Talaromyces pinophilus]